MIRITAKGICPYCEGNQMRNLEITAIPDEDGICKEGIIYCPNCERRYKVSQVMLSRKRLGIEQKDGTVIWSSFSELEISDIVVVKGGLEE